MTRTNYGPLLSLILCAPAFAISCGGDSDTGDESENALIGFATPDVVTTAYEEDGEVWKEVGAADWSCLGTASDEVPTTTNITLTGSVRDFQTDEELPGASVSLYPGAAISGSALAEATSDEEGSYSIELPSGQTTWAFRVVTEGALDTYSLNEYFQPSEAAQSIDLDSVSILTAQALPAFIGVTRTIGLGVVAGSIRDCQGRRVKGAVVQMSGTSQAQDPVDGGVSYYFSALSTSLPVRHSQQAYTNDDGVFVTIELPPGQERFLQVWGFVDEADRNDGEMTLLAEAESPIIADAVVKVTMRPIRE